MVSRINDKSKAIGFSAGSNSKSRFLTIVLAIAFALSVAIQIVQDSSRLVVSVWLSIFVLLVIYNMNSIVITGFLLKELGYVIVLFIYSACCAMVTNEWGYLTGPTASFTKAILIYTIGYTIAFSRINIDEMRLTLVAYVLGTVIYAIWILNNYFPGFSAWLSSKVYLFNRKNFFGHVAGIAIIILVYLHIDNNTFKKVPLTILMIFLLISLLFVQCRAALVAVALSSIIMLSFSNKMSHKLLLVSIALLAVLLTSYYSPVLSHVFFLDKYAGQGMDRLSSGRLGLYKQAIAVVSENNRQLIGMGNLKVDNMYINLYINIGVIGASIVLLNWFNRLYRYLPWKKQYNATYSYAFYTLLLGLSAYYLIEGLFESGGPYGNGTNAIVYWIINGFSECRAGLAGMKVKLEDEHRNA